jgi:hypothetical protein
VTVITNLALALAAAAIVALFFDELRSLGGRAWVLIATFAAMSMLVGHALGGPAPGTRMVVATFAALRFPALGLTIARIAASRDVVPVMLAYVLCSVLMLSVYLALERAAHAGDSEEPHGAAPPRGA